MGQINKKGDDAMKFLRDRLSHAASAVEVVLGIMILVACVVCSLGMVFTTNLSQLVIDPTYLRDRMSDVCLIIIGVELIEMISSHSIGAVVDVLLLAVARQMIVEHTAPMENMFTILSVGLLFVIRKFLYVSALDSTSHDMSDGEDKDPVHK